MRKAFYYAVFAVLAVGCGDNLRATGDDDAPDIDAADDPPDAEPGPDAFFCAANDPDELGGTCDPLEATACGGAAAGGTCLAGPVDVSVFPPEGYCVQSDFSDTFCDADADCGEGGVCAAVEFSFGTAAVCLPACCEFETCPTGQECWDTLNGLPMDKTACVPGDASAADGDTCAGFYECNESSQCANDFENPGGSCETFGCTEGSAAGCHGGDLCIVDDEEPPYETTICVNSCDDGSPRATASRAATAPRRAAPRRAAPPGAPAARSSTTTAPRTSASTGARRLARSSTAASATRAPTPTRPAARRPRRAVASRCELG
jgi:hypothetical protein